MGTRLPSLPQPRRPSWAAVGTAVSGGSSPPLGDAMGQPSSLLGGTPTPKCLWERRPSKAPCIPHHLVNPPKALRAPETLLRLCAPPLTW